LFFVRFCKILAVKEGGESIALEISSILNLLVMELFWAIKIVALKAYSVAFENIGLI
jgi:hypothetical protein